MTEVDKLRAARTLIDRPHKWCQWVSAQSQLPRGGWERVHVTTPGASRFCAAGACARVGVGVGVGFLIEALDEIHPTHFGVIDYQDKLGRTHAEVMHLFDKAIDLAVRAQREAQS